MSIRQPEVRALRLFLTAEHRCSYLTGRQARNLVADPGIVDNGVYSQLAGLGFRRSGDHVYRPHCAGCRACLSLRIPVAAFRPNRSQHRTWRRNQDLTVRAVAARFRAEHYRLFQGYLKARHPGGGMEHTDPESYLAFIHASWSDTVLYEFRLDGRLLAVAVVDRLNDALSAVYTFFDSEDCARGLGTYAILWQIHEALRRGLRWVYLGYWVRECGKMAYKVNFRPCEVFTDGHWVAVPPLSSG